MEKSEESKTTPYLLCLPSVILMVLVIVIPIINSCIQSFQDVSGAFTLENYKYFFSSKEAFDSLTFTLLEAVITMLISVTISFFLALYLRFSKSKISKIMGKLYILPRFIPSIVAVYAVMNVIKDSGLLNRLSISLWEGSFKPGLLYDIKGIIICNLWFNIPFSTMLISAALSNVQDSNIESAKDIGCSPWEILKYMVWPLIYKDVSVSATFILMGQIGAFTIPYLTGPNNPKMLGVLLYQQINVYMDYNRASALSVLMFLVCLLGAIFYFKTSMREDPWQVKKAGDN